MSHRFKQPFFESFAAEVIALLKREKNQATKPDSVYSSEAVQKGDDAAGHGKAFTSIGR